MEKTYSFEALTELLRKDSNLPNGEIEISYDFTNHPPLIEVKISEENDALRKRVE